MRIISFFPLHLSLLLSLFPTHCCPRHISASWLRCNSKDSFYLTVNFEQWWKTLQILINTDSMLHSVNNWFLSLDTAVRNHSVWPVMWTRVVIGVRPKRLWLRWRWYTKISSMATMLTELSIFSAYKEVEHEQGLMGFLPAVLCLVYKSCQKNHNFH